MNLLPNKQTCRTVFLFVLIIQCFSAQAQQKYWVFFTNKANTVFNPYTYFDAKAIERRIINNVSLVDSTDFPINEFYYNTVSANVDSVSNSTRWFNGMCVYANENQIQKIQQFYFVRSIEALPFQSMHLASYNETSFNEKLSDDQKKLLVGQTTRLQADEFKKANIDGSGIRIAIFDAGFPNVDKNPAFEHIRKANKIIKTYDFVRKKDFVYGYAEHGSCVLSCIAGKAGDVNIGLATGAEFLLARTEMGKREPFSEEENWLAAVEWSDKNGVQIINSSLGYTGDRYFTTDMNGKKSLVSRAANLAARKGILVVNAAGNEGSSAWKTIGTPADADSVLTVGGIDMASDFHTDFSSYGPTADNRLKPNVCAFGHVIAAGKNGLEKTQGTSFSSPLVAGFAACALQTNRNLKNMELYLEIEKSADLYPYFDYAHGYGVPQASYFTEKNKTQSTATFDFVNENNYLTVKIQDAFFGKDTIDTKSNRLYYHIENDKGVITSYYIISVENQDVLKFSNYDYKKGQKIMVHYKNYTNSFTF